MNLLVLLCALLAGLLAAESKPVFTSPKDPTPEYAPGLKPKEARAGWIIAAPDQLGRNVEVKAPAVRPTKMTPLLTSDRPWKVIPHPSLPRQRQAVWEELKDGAGGVIGLHAVGGPGCVELAGEYGDFVLQLDVRVRKPLANAGVFFRCMKGEFLNGYEAQVFNGCYDGDPAQPARWATGAIDDRVNVTRLVSRDAEPFTMTVIASGPHVSTWVNGVQVVDWTDQRQQDDNPRKGLRLKPGPIQLQAHDRNTDVEFTNIRIAPMD